MLYNNFYVLYIIFVVSTYCQLNIETDPSPSKSKCYPELGCVVYGVDWYDKTYRPINELPLAKHTINTQFLLFSHNKQEPNEPLVTEIVSATPATINISSYEPSLPTRLLIHDFTSSGYTGWTKHLARALLEKKKICGNVISVDWEAGAEPPYTQAIGNARLVALEILLFIAMLHSKFDLNHSKLHLIGHGVGAHIAGYVGEALKVNGQARLGKITALDPNGPYFEHMPTIVRLDIFDALFVEVIHTDGHPRGQGIMEALGHVDFYPNGGHSQPGCNVSDKYPHILKLTRDSIKPGDIYPGCSHKRAFKYYIESIRNSECTYLGFHCTNYSAFLKGGCTSCELSNVPLCAQIGLSTPYNDSLYKETCSTIYYLRTGASDTFCLDIYKFRVNFAKESKAQCEMSGYFEFNLTSSTSQLVINNISLYDKMNSQLNQCHGNYTFLGWAEPRPTVNRIASANIKWTNTMTIGKSRKNPIFISNVTITHLSLGPTIKNELCSEKTDTFQINSGETQHLHSCLSTVKNVTFVKSIANDSESNFSDNNVRTYY